MPANALLTGVETRIVEEIRRENHALVYAMAGVGFGAGVALSTGTMLLAVDRGLARWDPVAFTCMAAGMVVGIAFVAGFVIRLKRTRNHLTSVEEDLAAWCAHSEARNEALSAEGAAPPVFGKAVKRTRAAPYSMPLQLSAYQQTVSLLERCMLPRKDQP